MGTIAKLMIGKIHHLSGLVKSLSIFTLIVSVLLDWSNSTSCVFTALKFASHPLPQSTLSCRLDSSSEANSSHCCISDSWLHLRKRTVSSAKIAILQITSSRRTDNRILRNSSINWIFLWRLPIQNHLKAK